MACLTPINGLKEFHWRARFAIDISSLRDCRTKTDGHWRLHNSFVELSRAPKVLPLQFCIYFNFYQHLRID